MAATLMQQPAHRPSMDHVASFEQQRTSRPSSVAPFNGNYDHREPSPASGQQHQQQQPRSRTTSNTSAPPPTANASAAAQPAAGISAPTPQQYSPYAGAAAQPFFTANPAFMPPGAGWAPPPNGLPASSFYAAPFHAAAGAFPNGPTPHGPYQQGGGAYGQPDFSAWAHVYQQMVAGGHMPAPGHMPPMPVQRDVDDVAVASSAAAAAAAGAGAGSSSSSSSASSPPPAEPRRRTVSSASASSAKPFQQPQAPYHPYQRGPKHRSNGSRDTRSSMTGSILVDKIPPPSTNTTTTTTSSSPHTRSTSADSFSRMTASSANDDDLVPPPKLRDGSRGERPPSVKSQGSSRDGKEGAAGSNGIGHGGSSVSASANGNGHAAAGSRSPVSTTQSHSRTASPTVVASPTTSSTPSSVKSAPANAPAQPGRSAPLTTGSIAANATNAAARPSPLSQPAGPDQQQQQQQQQQKDMRARQQQQAPQQRYYDSKSLPAGAGRPSTSSRRPAAPTANGSGTDFAPPIAPFINVQAMGSDVSLAGTERTAATTQDGPNKSSSKRSLFRMKNKSSDNMSISSTVSSASMMIRKLGSIGKLARRNSLMGISKIFKDKPKDEDAPVPEKSGMLSFKKKSGKKAEVVPPTVTHTNAELDRVSEEEDRVLTGLTPAAALARQHTVRSRQEAARKAEEAAKQRAAAFAAQQTAMAELTGPSGEPTWDVNTTTRSTQMADASAAGMNVVRVEPRSSGGPTIVQAVGYNFDSDECSDDETMENVTSSLNRASLNSSHVDDGDFKPLWIGANVNHNAKPKKGILKNILSNEDLEAQVNRQRSSSTSENVMSSGRPVLSQLSAPSPARIDGVAHAHHIGDDSNKVENVNDDDSYNPLSPGFSPFDSGPLELDLKSTTTLYKRPVLNTSAPSLPLMGHAQPQAARAISAPIRRRLIWAPECAVYSTYDAGTYDRRSEPATCNRLTPELALAIKQELNAFKLEMPVHPSSRIYTHYFA